MKITIINGSPRKSGNGSMFLEKIKIKLQNELRIDVRLINLAEKDIKMCKGCQVCYKKGEDFCPLKDDVFSIKQNLLDCDGVVFYSPTYVVNMSGLMKNFIDRLSYFCHRPAFFKKAAFILTTTGSAGGASALKCMKWPLLAWGFRVVKCIDIKMAKYNYDPRYKAMISQSLDRAVELFVRQLDEKQAEKPNITELVGFSIKKRNYLKSKDVEYWKEKGWLDRNASYFFPAKIGILKSISSKALGQIVQLIM